VTGQWFSLGPLVSSTNKTYCHDITEILLKVALLNNKKILFYFRFRLPGVAGVLCADENGLCLAGNFYIFISINQTGILSEHYTFVYRRHIMNFNCWIPPLQNSRHATVQSD
jgi:hypothetical protein